MGEVTIVLKSDSETDESICEYVQGWIVDGVYDWEPDRFQVEIDQRVQVC